ncbi:MAG: multidrug efflux SMR transporter [Mucispirillum sp.]|nr:multidrug efflux SMR transporter [Mucispirillum sp.]
MSWVYLIIAGIFEIGWPIGFKLASVNHNHKLIFICLAVLSMALSGFFLFKAQEAIPIGTAYTVWVGIGAVGTVSAGIIFFGDEANFWKIFFICVIIAGVIGVKLTRG